MSVFIEISVPMSVQDKEKSEYVEIDGFQNEIKTSIGIPFYL
jgi:hypothetical protein